MSTRTLNNPRFAHKVFFGLVNTFQEYIPQIPIIDTVIFIDFLNEIKKECFIHFVQTSFIPSALFLQPQLVLGQKRNIKHSFLVQQLVHVVLERFLVRVQNARIVQQHLAVRQRQNAVPQPRNHLPILLRDGFVQVLRESTTVFTFGVHDGRYPDEPVVPQDD